MSHNKHAQHQAFTIEFSGIAHAPCAIALKEFDMTGPRRNPITEIEIDGKQIRFYHGGFPASLAREMESLYRNIFSSIEKPEADGILDNAEAYVSTSATGIETVLLFLREGGTVTVLNGAISVSARDVDIFCQAVFLACPGIHRIRFEAVECDMAGIKLPYQRYNCLENIVAELPDAVPDYLHSLGKGMRASIKRNMRKLETQVEGFHWQIYEGAAISGQDIQELINLSSARISSKNMKTSHTDGKTNNLIRLLKAAGSVLVARVNGQVCGGVIGTTHGGNFFMHVVAHDAAYRTFSLGKVCIYLTIRHAIEKGIREYHFLWGPYPYKFDFLGRQRNYDRIVIYRSAWWMAFSPRLFMMIALRGYGRRARLWLEDRKRTTRMENP